MQLEWIGQPVVQVLLVAVVFLSVLVEIKTGGLGIGALFGLIAAGVFFGSRFVEGLVSFFEIAMFLGGVLFIVIEVLTPGVGLFAGLGFVAIFYSFILALGGDSAAVYLLLISMAVAAAAFVLLLKRLPSSKLWSKVVLRNASTDQQGYVSASDASHLLGSSGLVVTELRPSGTAMIGEARVDVVSEGRFVGKGARVRVVAVQGGRVVVREESEA